MDTLKRVSKQWWFFWLTAFTYLAWSTCNTLHAYIIAIGRDGWKALDSFDYVIMFLTTVSTMCMTLRSLMNGDYGKAKSNTSNTNAS